GTRRQALARRGRVQGRHQGLCAGPDVGIAAQGLQLRRLASRQTAQTDREQQVLEGKAQPLFDPGLHQRLSSKLWVDRTSPPSRRLTCQVPLRSLLSINVPATGSTN